MVQPLQLYKNFHQSKKQSLKRDRKLGIRVKLGMNIFLIRQEKKWVNIGRGKQERMLQIGKEE